MEESPATEVLFLSFNICKPFKFQFFILMQTSKNRALITGASSGVGLEYAHELAKKRYNLLIISNEEEKLQQVAIEVSKLYNVHVEPLFLDLATLNAADQVYQFCQQKQFEIDILINNAGIFVIDELVRISPKKIETILLLHIVTPTKLCQIFGKEMKQRHHGYILNMSSLSAWMPYPGLNLYASSKNYLKSFTLSLRQELKEYNVSVTLASPGAIATDLYHLSNQLQKTAIFFGFMIPPNTFAKKAVKKMFRKKALIMPGMVNYLMLFFIKIIPLSLVRNIMRKTNLLPLSK